MLITNREIWLNLDSRTTGGIETHVLQLAKGLQNQKLNVRVIFIKNHGDHPLRDSLIQENIKTTSLDGSFWSLLKAIKILKPILIHSHGYKAGILSRIAARMTSTKIISTYHAGEPGFGKMKIYEWLDHKSSILNHQSFAVSHKIANQLPVTASVLDNFIELPEPPYKPGHQIAFVGRLSDEKGPDLLLQLAQNLKPVEFHIYGSGPLHKSLKNQAGTNVIFHGNQQSMEPHWKNIDLLLMPSRHEGLPLVALEAMARKIPVLAFNVGALEKVILNAYNGWLIDPENLLAFQNKLEDWLTMDTVFKQKIRTAARAHIHENFSSQKIIPEIIKHYAKAIGQPKASCIAFCKESQSKTTSAQGLKLIHRNISNL